ncbi:MAG: efflux RND transporter permease subunit [Planctomycetota bacterium]
MTGLPSAGGDGTPTAELGLPSLAVRRPVTVLMATIAVAVFGFLALPSFRVELLPSVAYPTLTVQTEYEDAAPESVEQFITKPIEESIGVIPGVRDLRSTSRAGISEVVLEFEWGEEMDFAALDVREKLGLLRLPLEASQPRVLRFDPSLDPVVRIALTGTRPLGDLRQLAERLIKPRFEAVRGVAVAKVRGGLDPEIRVDVDVDRLAALGLALDDVAEALQAENVNRPGGKLKDWGSVYLVRTLHEFADLDQIRRTIVRDTGTGRIRVEDVARVARGHRDRDVVTRHDGTEGVELALHREGSANTMRVVEGIRNELDRIRHELPADVELVLLSDQSLYIGEAIGQVLSAALLGGLLAIVIIFFFLRDVLATAIVAVSIPASVIGTFLPLAKAGVSLNIMSLGGLALGVGMLVDNSIVVLEAIDRRRREGRSRRAAAVKGASDVAGAVTAATLTTVSVFLPIVFVTGIAGQLFHDLALTVCLSLVASLIVSLTLIPTLASLELDRNRAPSATLFAWDRATGDRPPFTLRLGRLTLPPIGDGRHWMSRLLTVLFLPPRLALALVLVGVAGGGWIVSWLFHVVSWPMARAFDLAGRAYPKTLRGALRARWVILPAALALFVVSLVVGSKIATNLVPDLAQGEFAFQLRFAEGTTLEANAAVVASIEERLQDDPRFARLFSVIGSLPSTASGRQTLGENLAQINFTLPEDAEAGAEASAVAHVRRVLATFPTAEAELVRPSVLSMQPPVEVKIFADDLESLTSASRAIAAAVDQVDGVRDIATTDEPGSPEIRVVPDRERASALGLSTNEVSLALQAQIRGRTVGEFREDQDRIDIRLRARRSDRDRASSVRDLDVQLPGGRSVPVSAVADVVIDRGPAAIYRADGARVARVTAAASAGELGRVIDDVSAAVAAARLPADTFAELGGQNDELERSLASLRLALLLAIFLVFVVMAMQFESLIHPLVILFTVPLGAIGVIAALRLAGTGISILSLIGAVMLAGIVVNNAIVLVDAINRHRSGGAALNEAIVAASVERLRPILMTTATTVLALLPMALGLGAGDELRRPMAVTVIGGLTAATLLTLFVIPCAYRLASRRRLSTAPEIQSPHAPSSPVAPDRLSLSL